MLTDSGWARAAQDQPVSEVVVNAGAGVETTVATATLAAAPAGTYLALATITAYSTGTTVAGYARLYAGATQLQNRRNDLLVNAAPSQEHACLVPHPGGDLTVTARVFCAAAYTIQPRGCSLVIVRIG